MKDLSRLGRDLRRVLILDNSPASYVFHPDNAVSATQDRVGGREPRKGSAIRTTGGLPIPMLGAVQGLGPSQSSFLPSVTYAGHPLTSSTHCHGP